jgi:hypothetical protein
MCDKGLSCLGLCRYISAADEIARTPHSHPSFSLRGFASGYDQTWSSDENIAAQRSLLFFTIKVGCVKVDAYPGEHKFAVDLVLKR